MDRYVLLTTFHRSQSLREWWVLSLSSSSSYSSSSRPLPFIFLCSSFLSPSSSSPSLPSSSPFLYIHPHSFLSLLFFSSFFSFCSFYYSSTFSHLLFLIVFLLLLHFLPSPALCCSLTRLSFCRAVHLFMYLSSRIVLFNKGGETDRTVLGHTLRRLIQGQGHWWLLDLDVRLSLCQAYHSLPYDPV